mmetsp:Transcript_79046/g.177081  ORF Transcript_79046/g.177081 Transcript_79046/m.177081 type:complete len:338 (-) Transcript_79046:173-1186(-)
MAQLQLACFAGLLTFVAALNSRSLQAPNLHLLNASQDVAAKLGKDDLAFMHVPYNFGHTVEITKLLPTWMLDATFLPLKDGVHGGPPTGGTSLDAFDKMATKATGVMAKIVKWDSEEWGHLDPDLQAISPVTGCGLYFTPQKYWPEDLLKKKFGNKKVFGLLRDPYERLIAMFRGGITGYGAANPKFFETCDVNGALQEMMNSAIKSKNPFGSSCTFLPQAEYFDGPYGITLPVDNRRFPQSMNEFFGDHGYSERIKGQNIFHVNGCNNVWAGNLTAETKQMVKKVYARDFELLCKYFGYCDDEENDCITGVYHMCPENLFSWNSKLNQYIRRAIPI